MISGYVFYTCLKYFRDYIFLAYYLHFSSILKVLHNNNIYYKNIYYITVVLNLKQINILMSQLPINPPRISPMIYLYYYYWIEQ